MPKNKVQTSPYRKMIYGMMEQGLSDAEIKKLTGLSHSTINKYRVEVQDLGIVLAPRKKEKASHMRPDFWDEWTDEINYLRVTVFGLEPFPREMRPEFAEEWTEAVNALRTRMFGQSPFRANKKEECSDRQEEKKKKMIGQNIRNLRLSHDMSMRDLADKLGTTDSTVCRWEHGLAKISTEAGIKIADLFRISLDELADRKRDE